MCVCVCVRVCVRVRVKTLGVIGFDCNHLGR